MTAHRLDPRVERRVAAETRVDRERPGDERGRHRTLGRKQGGERERRRHLRAVEQRESLLRPEHDRRQSRRCERVAPWHRATIESCFTLADQHGGQMRERRQVAGCADRSLRGDARHDTGVRKCDERFDHAPAHAGMPACERSRLQRDREADDGVVEQRARAGGMRKHERTLQLGKARRVDARACEEAKPRVDAVDGRPRGDHACDGVGGGVDRRPRRPIHRERQRGHPQPAKIGQRERTGSEHQR